MTVKIHDQHLVVDLKSESGRALADLILQTIWTYASRNDPEVAGRLEHVAKMIKGDSPMINTNVFSEVSDAT